MSKKILSSEEEFSIPLDINELLTVCREFNQLGDNIQKQVELILEFGLDESINEGFIRKETLPAVKRFLQTINNNYYFGDASEVAGELIKQIDSFSYQQIYKTAN